MLRSSDRSSTWKDEPFFTRFWDAGRNVAPENVGKMIDHVVAGNGRISFNLAGMAEVDGIVAGTSKWGSYQTGRELSYVCGNAAARAITTFFGGAAPC